MARRRIAWQSGTWSPRNRKESTRVMDQRKQRFRLGLSVVIATALSGGMILLFGGAPQRFFASRNTYTIIFADAPGIGPGTPGAQVGRPHRRSRIGRTARRDGRSVGRHPRRPALHDSSRRRADDLAGFAEPGHDHRLYVQARFRRHRLPPRRLRQAAGAGAILKAARAAAEQRQRPSAGELSRSGG